LSRHTNKLTFKQLPKNKEFEKKGWQIDSAFEVK
jgi:hypothetical protein